DQHALPIHAAHLTSVMLLPCNDAAHLGTLLDDKRKNVVLLGPGLMSVTDPHEPSRTKARQWVTRLFSVSSHRRIVLDADALTCFSDHLEDLCSFIRTHHAPVVLTPHEGEFARLFQSCQADLEALPSKWQRAQWAAQKTGAILVLKGGDTVIAH